jgi:hypothetical protein
MIFFLTFIGLEETSQNPRNIWLKENYRELWDMFPLIGFRGNSIIEDEEEIKK